MPFYEYQCSECGEIFEILLPIKSCNDVMACGKCGAAATRIVSKFNMVTISKPKRPKENRESTNTGDVGRELGSTGVRLEGGSTISMKNCSFKNLETGISMAKGTKISMDGSKFENVVNPFQVTDE